jgi:hypothetical protein
VTRDTVFAELHAPDKMRRAIFVDHGGCGRHRRHVARTLITAVFTLLTVVFPLFSCRAVAAPKKIVISYAILSEREGVLMVARDHGITLGTGELALDHLMVPALFV